MAGSQRFPSPHSQADRQRARPTCGPGILDNGDALCVGGPVVLARLRYELDAPVLFVGAVLDLTVDTGGQDGLRVIIERGGSFHTLRRVERLPGWFPDP